MSNTSTASDNIRREEKGEITTLDNAKMEKGSIDWFSHLGDPVNKLSVPRLFLILTFIIYGIIAFSKKEAGVNSYDLSIFIFFIIFVILIFGILVISRDLYRKNNSFNFIFLKRISQNSRTLILLTIIIFFLFTYFRSSIIEFFNVLIKSATK